MKQSMTAKYNEVLKSLRETYKELQAYKRNNHNDSSGWAILIQSEEDKTKGEALSVIGGWPLENVALSHLRTEVAEYQRLSKTKKVRKVSHWLIRYTSVNQWHIQREIDRD